MTVDLTVLITLNGIKRDKKPQHTCDIYMPVYVTNVLNKFHHDKP